MSTFTQTKKKKPPLDGFYNWRVGRDWLRRNFVFELATNGVKEVVAPHLPIYLLA